MPEAVSLRQFFAYSMTAMRSTRFTDPAVTLRGLIDLELAMPTNWIDVVDSAIKVGLGAFAGGGFALALERIRQRNEERRRRDELRWTLLVQPIVAFVDDLMAAVGEVYWSHIDGKPPRLEEKMMFFRERQGAVEARIAALGNAQLTQLWGPFTHKVIIVRMRIEERERGEKDAYDEMTEGFALGGKILSLLFAIRPIPAAKTRCGEP